MVYDHAVKANGVFYPAGAEVPEPANTAEPEKNDQPSRKSRAKPPEGKTTC